MVTIIRDKILDYMGLDSAPMVIVGNKSDLDSQRYVWYLVGLVRLGRRS